MTFTNLSLGAVVGGSIALAAVLFLIQRLRVRHRRREVITTLFWRAAVEEARARVFMERFRHPLAYLLVLLICCLLWLGLSGPESSDPVERDVVVLLDGSAAMMSGSRFELASSELQGYVRGLNPSRRTVRICAGGVSTLLLPGESDQILARRLDEVRPMAAPSSVAAEVFRLIETHPADVPLDVVLVSDVPLPREVMDLAPASMRIRHLEIPDAAGKRNNVGITALGISPAASGKWDRLDVLVETWGEVPGAEPLFEVAGSSMPLDALAQDSDAFGRRLLRDIPARGGTLFVSFGGGDDNPADDAGSVALPDRKPIRVALRTGLADLFHAVLRADAAVVLVDEQPDVVIRDVESTEFPGTPGLVLVPVDGQADTILLGFPPGRDVGDALVESFDRFGLDQVDAMELAQEVGRVVTVGATESDRRSVGVHRQIFSGNFNFVRSRSFPLFVARTVRWLSGAEDFAHEAAAGRPMETITESVLGAQGDRFDPVGEAFVPPVAGDYHLESGTSVAASLLDRQSTRNDSQPMSTDAVTGADTFGSWDLVTLMGAMAMLMLLVEWFLCRTGRVP